MRPMHNDGMKLDQYMAENGITDVALAAKIGVASTTVLRWRRGDTYPDWRALPLLIEATGGAVMPNDFLGSVGSNKEGYREKARN